MIITVGGVQKDGSLWHSTSLHRYGELGSMSVYAPTVDVVVPGPGESVYSGTTQATAIVVSAILIHNVQN